MTRTTHGQDPATPTPTPAKEMLESALIVLRVTTFMGKLDKVNNAKEMIMIHDSVFGFPGLV